MPAAINTIVLINESTARRIKEYDRGRLVFESIKSEAKISIMVSL